MFEIASYTAPGEGSENQDAYEIHPHPENAEYRLFALADGQGGREGAATAASTACRTLIRAASSYAPGDLIRSQSWKQLMPLADKAVLHDCTAGFTTLVAFCITPMGVCGASSGDSAVLLANGDQTAEILTAGQFKNPPVGSGNARFSTFSARLTNPWTLIAMSDGVWKYTGWDPICRIAASHGPSQGIIHCLRNYAASPVCGQLQDDFTLVVFQSAMTEINHAGR